MKTDTVKKFNFDENKKEIFDKIVSSIDSAMQKDLQQIFIKKLKIVEEEIDVVADRSEWETCLTKALAFYMQNDHYEDCAICDRLIKAIKNSPKKTN